MLSDRYGEVSSVLTSTTLLLVSIMRIRVRWGLFVSFMIMVQPLPGIVMTTATFAAVGGIFTGATAVAEDVRGKQDIWNGAIAGIAAGSVVGLRSGSLYASAGACGAFAAMSIILEILGGTMGPVEDRNAERRADLYR